MPQNGHYYDTTEQICRVPLSQDQRGQINRATAVPDGMINPSRSAGTYPVGGWLFGIIPTTGGYVTTRFSANGNIAVNTTTSAHLFVGTRQFRGQHTYFGEPARERDAHERSLRPGQFRQFRGHDTEQIFHRVSALASYMARLSRIVIPGVAHHVTPRGNRRQPAFFSENGHDLFQSRRSIARFLAAWRAAANGNRPGARLRGGPLLHQEGYSGQAASTSSP